RGWTLIATGAARGEDANLRDPADGVPDPPASRRTGLGGGLTLQWRPAFGVTVHGAMRADRLLDRIHWIEVGGGARSSETRRTLTSPQLGLRVRGPWGAEVRANWADAQRAPDFLELFGNQGSVMGNPELRPERARNWDAGLAWSAILGGRAATLDIAHFGSRSDDLVVYVQHSQSSLRAMNIARSVTSGQELSLALRDPSGIALTGGLTHLDARDRGPFAHWHGRRLPLRPAWQGFGRLDARRGRVRAFTDLQVIGVDYLDPANLRPVSGRLLIGSSLTFTPERGGLRFTLEGRNLGNDRVSDVGGFPLPGRSWFASCELRLGPGERATR
ncbi:MAG TPA: TonB-dependent receptor, partial [Candidatus Eisenbacteria bacterium]|nr:TonB-dependent receptor [Candidatus Eisenbacteria bacterium]